MHAAVVVTVAWHCESEHLNRVAVRRAGVSVPPAWPWDTCMARVQKQKKPKGAAAKAAAVAAAAVPKPEPVVPITWKAGRGIRSVIITGPNTGGKTAALKSLGLSVMLAMSGCGVPARAPARLPPFSAVLADIGDSQVRVPPLPPTAVTACITHMHSLCHELTARCVACCPPVCVANSLS